MSEWTFGSSEPSEQLARLQFFSVIKQQPEGDVEFRITVREYARPQSNAMHFFAEADKQTNQSTAPFTPCGWGPTLLDALSRCIQAIRRFPYEPPPQE